MVPSTNSDMYCHPLYATHMDDFGVDIHAPQPPFVLAKVLARLVRESPLFPPLHTVLLHPLHRFLLAPLFTHILAPLLSLVAALVFYPLVLVFNILYPVLRPPLYVLSLVLRAIVSLLGGVDGDMLGGYRQDYQGSVPGGGAGVYWGGGGGPGAAEMGGRENMRWMEMAGDEYL